MVAGSGHFNLRSSVASARGDCLKQGREFEAIQSRQMEYLRVFHDVASTLATSLELEDILRVSWRRWQISSVRSSGRCC